MEFNLNVSDKEINIIGLALQKLPYEVVYVLIDKLNAQVKNQQIEIVEVIKN